ASAVTCCWNLLSCAISLRCCSEQERDVHASARVSGCFGCSCRAGGPIGNAVCSSCSPRLFCVGAVAAYGQSGCPAHMGAGVAGGRGGGARGGGGGWAC